MLWDKARLKLVEEKLRGMYSELVLHDKEELTLKRLKADKMDKDGSREAQVRKNYMGIMNRYHAFTIILTNKLDIG